MKLSPATLPGFLLLPFISAARSKEIQLTLITKPNLL
jgi:hypothetical protein